MIIAATGLVPGRRLLVERLRAEDDLEAVLGLEGMAAALYFGQFGKLLLPTEMTFHGRSRRPPRDPVNACLSFGYALLGTVVETEVLRVGLDPLVGFFHQPHSGRSSLALDLLEGFRPFIDSLVLRLVNRQQLGPVDFERRGGPELAELLSAEGAEEAPAEGEEAVEGVYLADTGRRVFRAGSRGPPPVCSSRR
jgi:CRISPR-associated protein Cas1